MHKLEDKSNQEPDDLSESLQRIFEETGASCTVDESFLDRYGMDFTITGFEQLHAHVNLGVNLTIDLDDLEQLERFAEGARRGVTAKAIYVEVDESTVETGGIFAAYAACLSWLFDASNEQERAVGVRIRADSSYDFFDVDESISRLQRMAEDAELRIGDDLEGRIIAYFTNKGFGFIETDDARKYFFHIANVGDDALRQRLPHYRPGEVIPVDFQYGGDDGQRYPKAFNILFAGEE